MQNNNTFPKCEHLCGKTTIDELYEKGEGFFSYPVRVMYRIVDNEEIPVRCLVNAPKRRFKHAVDRNKIKRQLREAYRKNKQDLINSATQKGVHLHIAFNYVGEKVEKSDFIEKKIISALGKLIQRISK